jgi:translocation and assembly module TamA
VTGAVFREEEDFLLIREASATGMPSGPDTEIRQGVEVQQNRELRGSWDVLYGLRFKRVSAASGRFDQDVLGFEVSLVRDTRDNPLDSREGRFYSLAFEGGPRVLGSDLRFFRAFGQVFLARPLGESLSWAQGYRLGLATGLDQRDLQDVQLFGRSTELFRAGGANSIRGFAADSVGPQGPFARVSPGGQAVVVVNQELRYRHPTGLGAAVFYDAGNVYRRIRDLDFGLRHSVGVGARYESPVGLLRFDVAFPLNRRPDDRSFQWFFTLGQAF